MTVPDRPMNPQPRAVRLGWLVLLVVATGVLLRSLRLASQPLWWDEGYSVYFATEPLSRMAWLTAHDIHPPLYYALLHGWFTLAQQTGPVTARILSVLAGVAALPLLYWLARRMYPARRRVAWVALLLLVVNPMHLFYSQEVRMYGLGMMLSLASMMAYTELLNGLQVPGAFRWRTIWLPITLFTLLTAAGLYTLYYFGLLLLAQCIWAVWALRRHWRRLAGFGATVIAAIILYLPWLVYATPLLIEYVGGKVKSDQDLPLGPMAYIERHLAAFTTGHVGLGAPWEAVVIGLASLAIAAILVGVAYRRSKPNAQAATPSRTQPTAALWVWLLVPITAGWLINLRFPFFPAGGERLLLIVLPYFLLLLALGIDETWRAMQLGKLAFGALLLAGSAGLFAFYTVPRYAADDYRPLLRQIVQQGANEDRILAIFPWQVGYWRAYTPQQDPLVTGPSPLLLADSAVDWSPDVQATIEQALTQGTVWFPEPLTFGSSLPPAIETYLAARAINLENRWYDATRLTAWRTLERPVATSTGADFGVAALSGAGIAPAEAPSANSPVAVSLAWDQIPPAETNVSLRLQDGVGRVWANRDFVVGNAAPQVALSNTVGLIAPVGLPPGAYTVTLGLQDKAGSTLTVKGSDVAAAPLGGLTIALPEAPISALRLPIQTPLSRPLQQDGLVLLGHSGADRPTPSGSELTLSLFLQSVGEELAAMNIYVSLLDPQGNGIAGYEGWPLPAYPTEAWPPGALVQAPVGFYVPGAAATGEYRLVAGLVNTATGTKSPAVELAKVRLEQRPATFTAPVPAQSLAVPAQFGTHVNLIGYDWREAADGQVALRLYWQVLQPLLPPHHIFVHADAPDGQTVAQQDGAPVTENGVAPTGGWQPGEYLVTEHLLSPPADASYTVNVGIYDPESLVRLPVTIAGAPAGDNVELPRP